MRFLVTPTLILSCLLFAACDQQPEAQPETLPDKPVENPVENPVEIPVKAEPYSGPTETILLDIEGMT